MEAGMKHGRGQWERHQEDPGMSVTDNEKWHGNLQLSVTQQQKCERCLTVLERDAPVVEHDWAVSVRDEHTKRFYRMWKAVCMKCAEAVEGFHPFWLEKNLRHCKQCNRPVYKRWGRKAVLCSRQCQTRFYREQKRRQSGKVGAHVLCSVCSQPFQPK